MIVDTPKAFRNAVQALQLTNKQATFPKQLLLIRPNGMSLSQQTAQDNRYMQLQSEIDIGLAIKQHGLLVDELQKQLPIKTFNGKQSTPDAVFPNNVFATTENKLIIGAMRYDVRQREAHRQDIIQWFRNNAYQTIDLSTNKKLTAELTGSLIIDRARGIGYCGLSERCNRAGAEAMHQAFDLNLSFIFELTQNEYHTNVIMSVLASHALIIHPDSFADPQVAQAICEFYAPHVAVLNAIEKNHFCANAISVDQEYVWLSKNAEQNLTPENRAILENAGFTIKHVDLSEIEKSGGSLRCCVMEIF